MSNCDYNPYVLPTIDFVAGETQDLVFNIYFHHGNKPYDLGSCTATFSVANYMNRSGSALISKAMTVRAGTSGKDNVLAVTLKSSDTLNMAGKYIYQITLQDVDGDVEIPKQGILMITNNIDKKLLFG